jgi:hypothetical protein
MNGDETSDVFKNGAVRNSFGLLARIVMMAASNHSVVPRFRLLCVGEIRLQTMDCEGP